MVKRLQRGLPHQAGRAGQAVEPRQRHHLEDRRDAAPFVADALAPRAGELDLARRVAPVAELVLQALQADRVARAVGPEARQQEAGDAAFGLREHQPRVAHRRREEPLVADQLVAAVGLAQRLGRVRAHVGAALLLGHAHADRAAGLLGGRHAARVVRERADARQPRLGERRRLAQRRHDRVRHRQRAAGPAVGLVVHEEQRGPRDVGARALGMPPCVGVHAVLHPERHQAVVGGMELDLVEAPADPIERLQAWPVLVRGEAERHHLAAGDGAERRQVGHRPRPRPRARPPRAAPCRCGTGRAHPAPAPGCRRGG